MKIQKDDSTSANLQVGKVDPVPLSRWNAVQQQINHATSWLPLSSGTCEPDL